MLFHPVFHLKRPSGAHDPKYPFIRGFRFPSLPATFWPSLPGRDFEDVRKGQGDIPGWDHFGRRS